VSAPRPGGGAGAAARLVLVAEALTHNLWLLPVASISAAAALSVALLAVDHRIDPDATAWYLFRGGPEGARSILSAVASSIMSLTAVVFSVTILVLQVASRQFSPRVLRTFLGDRATQAALGVFLGTFVYALLTLRSVRGATDGVEEFVPSLSVWLAVLLAGACVVAFVAFIHHVAQSIRAVNVLARIGDETREALATLYPEGLGDDPDEEFASSDAPVALLVLHRGRSGVLVAVDEERIWRLACGADVTVSLVPMPGDFVPQGGVLFEVRGDPRALDGEALAAAVAIGRERTLRQDPGFGFRSLVDVAERALSPGTNDPTTAVQALDELHDLLRRLCTRRFPAPARADATGRPRVILPRPDFDAYVRLAVDEIRHYGRGSVQVARRLRFLLEDVLAVAPPSRRGELQRQLEALAEAVRDRPGLSALGASASRPSAQGHGA
jgi:uncharacterized membrane protein